MCRTGLAQARRGPLAGVESVGRMLADRIFGAPERRDPPRPSPKAVAVGVAAIAAGLLLALAAQTAGLGPEGVRKGLFDPNFFPHHGGGLGETLYWATSTLFDRIGAHIVAIVLLVSGTL